MKPFFCAFVLCFPSMKKILFILVFLCSFNMFGQDSLIVNTPKIINQDSLLKEQVFFTIAPRFGAGIHHNPYYEIGISGIYINLTGLAFPATSVYGTMIFHQTAKGSSFDTRGFKVGVQSSWAFLMWGIELKHLSFQNEEAVYFPFKLGLSILDCINVEYAINLNGVSERSVIQTKHMFGINFSLNRKIYRSIKNFK